jgi:hypothetical protein
MIFENLDDIEIFVESSALYNGIVSESFSQKYLNQHQSLWKVKVIAHEFIPKEKNRFFVISIPSFYMISNLKDMFVMLVSSLNNIEFTEDIQFRKVYDSNAYIIGPALMNENIKLEALELLSVSDDDEQNDIKLVLRAEKKFIYDLENEIELIVNIENDDSLVLEPNIFSLSATLSDIKVSMMKKYNLAGNASEYIVHRCESNERSISKLCLNEHLTLAKLKFLNGHFIWISKGSLPKNDMLEIRIYINHPVISLGGLKNREYQLTSTSTTVSGLIHLGTVEIPKKTTISQLKKKILDSFPDISCKTPDEIRMRSMSKRQALGKLICGQDRAVPSKESEFAIETLPQAEHLSSYATIVRVWSVDSEGNTWPRHPAELVMDLCASPTRPLVLNWLRNVFGLDSGDCYQWNWRNREWEPIDRVREGDILCLSNQSRANCPSPVHTSALFPSSTSNNSLESELSIELDI